MVQITIDVPDELERKAKILNIELRFLLAKLVKDRLNELDEIDRFKRSIAKSKLTEKDVEELTDKINESMWRRHKQYEASRS